MQGGKAVIEEHAAAMTTEPTTRQLDELARACQSLVDAKGGFRRALGAHGALYGLTVVDALLARLAHYDDPSRLDLLAGD